MSFTEMPGGTRGNDRSEHTQAADHVEDWTPRGGFTQAADHVEGWTPQGGHTQVADHVEGWTPQGGHTQVADRIERRQERATSIIGRGENTDLAGWLIALNGPVRGTDYRIFAGNNFIGRSSGDICLHDDPTVSKVKNSCLSYDPRKKSFTLTHENGINPTLLNGSSVNRDGREVSDFDVITIGQTQLLFRSLCGKNFEW